MSPWSKEAIEALIEGYKARPSLYVQDSPNYHSRNLRQKYEEDLSKIVSCFRSGTTSVEIRNKIRGLRTSYLYERRKLDKAEMLSLEESYVPSLWYFDRLKFLDKYMKCKSQANVQLNIEVPSPSGSCKLSQDSDDDNKIEMQDLIQEQIRKHKKKSVSTDPLTTFDNDDVHKSNDLNNDEFVGEDLLLEFEKDTKRDISNVKFKKKAKEHRLHSSKKTKKKQTSNNKCVLKNMELLDTSSSENITQGQIFGRYVGWVIDNISDPKITMNLRQKIMEYLNEAEKQFRNGISE